jgi:hypothetical protein
MGSSLGELFKKRKVIYPREPTDADELYKEMLRNNRELGNMLVEKPRMFTPRVALLTFYPLAPVPQEISAFGGMLRVKEYVEREKQGGGGRGRGIGRGRGRGRGGGGGRGATAQGRGGHEQTARADPGLEGEGNNSNRTSEMTTRRGRMRQGWGR